MNLVGMMKCNKVNAIVYTGRKSLKVWRSLYWNPQSSFFNWLLGGSGARCIKGKNGEVLTRRREEDFPPQLTSKQGKGHTNPSGGSGGAVDFVWMGVWVLECPGRVSGAHLEVPFILFYQVGRRRKGPEPSVSKLRIPFPWSSGCKNRISSRPRKQN